MKEFFKGWRRKIGVLTLVMALMAMGAWVRGFAVQDLILFGNGQRVTTRGPVLVLLASSARDGVVWAKEETGDFLMTWLAGWQLRPTEGEYYFDPFTLDGVILNPDSVVYHWQLFGFDIMRYHDRNYGIRSILRISYPSIVVPLTLISLWLLLSNPRKSTSEKITEPTAEQGT